MKDNNLNIKLSAPFIEEDDIKAVTDVLKTRWLSLGPKLKEFEEKFAKYVGSKHAIAVNSGTSALHLAIKSLGIKPGDEVITTPFTFVASANCVIFEGATPVFADIKKDTFNIDPGEVEKKITERTKAIIDVDVFGYPSDKEKIHEIAKKYNLKVIEDSAEAIGASYKGKKVGTFFDCGIYAFYPNKQMTTGEGGIIVTDNDDIAQLCRSYRNQGRDTNSGWLDHVRIGYNYRLSDINCALGISQLEKIEKILEKRREVAKEYTRLLSNIPSIKVPPRTSSDNKISWFVYVIQVENRDKFMEELKKRGIACSNYFQPVHLTEFYKNEFGFKKGSFPITEEISTKTLALPFYTAMEKEDIQRVCLGVKEIQEEINGKSERNL